MEKPSQKTIDVARFAVKAGANFVTLCECLRNNGVEQYFRANGWGNLEWQADKLLKQFEREGVLQRHQEGRFTLIAKTQ
jgi:hypothetical protein